MNEGSLGHKRMVRKVTSLQLQSAKDPDNKKIAGDAYLAFGKGNLKKGFRKNRVKKGSGDYETNVGKHYINKSEKMKESLELLRTLIREGMEKKVHRMGKVGKPSGLSRLLKMYKGTHASKAHDAMQAAEDKADERAEKKKEIKEGFQRTQRLTAKSAKQFANDKVPYETAVKTSKLAARERSKNWLRRYLKSKKSKGGSSDTAMRDKEQFSRNNRYANESIEGEKKKEVPEKKDSPKKSNDFWKRRNEMRKKNPQNYKPGYTGKDLKKYTDNIDHKGYLDYFVEKILFLSNR